MTLLHYPRCTRRLLFVLVVLAGVHGAARAQLGINQYACGALRPPGQFGPFDYRTVDSEIRHRVEDYHFTQDVENTTRGVNGTVGSDLDYTLRAFPNNPRALLAASRLASRTRTERAPGLRFTTECYFERAIRFVPDDPMPRLLYAAYLKERKRMPELRTQLEEAERLRGDPTNFDFDYNLGLLYFEAGAYDKSMAAAERAYALGAPLPALMNKLKAAKKWREPAAPPAVVAPPASLPSSSAADPAK